MKGSLRRGNPVLDLKGKGTTGVNDSTKVFVLMNNTDLDGPKSLGIGMDE